MRCAMHLTPTLYASWTLGDAATCRCELTDRSPSDMQHRVIVVNDSPALRVPKTISLPETRLRQPTTAASFVTLVPDTVELLFFFLNNRPPPKSSPFPHPAALPI